MKNYLNSKSSGIVIWFLLALLVSYLMRVIISPDPLNHPDALSYHANAKHLLEYGEIRDAYNGLRAWRPPGATLFFATIYGISGVDPKAIILVQLIMFAFVISVLSDATRRITGNVMTGHLAGVLGLLFYSVYNYSTVLLSEQLHLFFLSIALWLFVFIERAMTKQARLWKIGFAAFGFGLCIGLATIAKSYLLYFPIYLLIVMILLLILRRVIVSARLSKLFIFGMIGFLVVVAPFLVRNYNVIGSYNKLVTYGGYNLLLGNYALSEGDWLNPTSHKWYAEIEKKMSNVSAGIVGEAEIDSALSREALDIIATHPGLFLLKSAGQAVRLLTTAGAFGDGIERIFSMAFYITFVVFTGFGLILCSRLSNPLYLGFLIFVSYVVIVFSATFSSPRLNMPFTIVFPSLCAIAIDAMFRRGLVHLR